MNEIGLITVKSSFPILKVWNISIEVFPQEHGKATIEALLPEEGEIPILKATKERISILIDGKIIFCGLLCEISMQRRNKERILFLTLYTDTILMDLKKKRRSFPEIKQPYEKIWKQIIESDAKGSYKCSFTEEEYQRKFWLQYDETDWEFLKRIVSQLGTILIPDITGEKLQLFIGLPELPEKTIKPEEVIQLEKEFFSGEQIESISQGKLKKESLGVLVQLKEDYKIGTDLRWGSQVRTIIGKRIVSKRGMIEYYYLLQHRKSALANPMWNETFSGLSIRGKVIEVKLGKGRVQLEIDEKPPKEDSLWFPIATPYSAEGGTGLYWMPEEGEEIELVLTEKEEANAFLRVGKRKEGEKNKKIKEPEKKYLGIPNKTEIKFGEKEIKINGKINRIYVKLEEEEGIILASEEDIIINSKEEIKLQSEKMTMAAKEKLVLEGGASSIIEETMVHIKGKSIEKHKSML